MYRVYGKLKKSNRFRAFDMQNNVFVSNLMFASMFDESQLNVLKKEIVYMNQANADYSFEIRKVK